MGNVKKTVEANNNRIDFIHKQIAELKKASDITLNLIGFFQEELQDIQSENAIMAEEMKAGKHLES